MYDGSLLTCDNKEKLIIYEKNIQFSSNDLFE